MIGLMILVMLLTLVGLVVFIQLSQQHIHVKRQRTLLWDAVLKEHRYWHLCTGGLSVDENGAIAHFAPDEGHDYDGNRKVRL
jgi:hypothetical protein